MRKGNLLLIILVIVGIMAASIGGYFWWQNKTTNESKPLTWEECVKIPGSGQLMTYPPQCVAPDGRKVTQPIVGNNTITSGIYGKAMIGPTCPGPERPGQTCTAPYVGTIDFVGKDGKVTTTTTAKDGSFRISLAPGDYIAERTDTKMFNLSKTQIHVAGNQLTQINIDFDTGIR